MSEPKTGFSLFLSLWNQMQGYQTPDVHFRIAEWLETSWMNGDRFLLLMAFRACGKSTLVGLFVVWVLYQNPDLRVLVLSAEGSLASKMAGNIKRIIEKHPLTMGMKPAVPEKWAGDCFTIARQLEVRDPSVLARGITANITGARADLIICDDVEVPNTCGTAEKRAHLRERLAEINFILMPTTTVLFVGTPHSYYSIYADKARDEIGEDVPYLQGYKRLVVPILDPQGQSVWPERFSLEVIEDQRQKVGPNKFQSQMMLEPFNILDGRLNPELLQYYDDEIVYSEAQQKPVLTIGGVEMVSASAWWDPSFGGARNDASVVAIIFSDANGNKYIQNVSYINIDQNSKEDEATQQCQQVARLMRQYYVPSVAVEINGIGRFLPSILRRALGQLSVGCAVVEMNSRVSKSIRILEAFDAPMAARALHVHRCVTKTPFITEMQEWQPDQKGGHDDGLDAVAGALSLEPVRIKRVYAGTHTTWGNNAQSHKAKTVIE